MQLSAVTQMYSKSLNFWTIDTFISSKIELMFLINVLLDTGTICAIVFEYFMNAGCSINEKGETVLIMNSMLALSKVAWDTLVLIFFNSCRFNYFKVFGSSSCILFLTMSISLSEDEDQFIIWFKSSEVNIHSLLVVFRILLDGPNVFFWIIHFIIDNLKNNCITDERHAHD